MILDFIYLLILFIFLFRGFKKGLVYALFSFLAIIIGVIGALKLSSSVSALLFDHNPNWARWTPLFTYLLVFFIIVWLIRICGSLIQKSLHIIALGFLNRLFGAFVYGILISFVFSIFLWLFSKMDIISLNTIEESKVYPIIRPLADLFFEAMSALLPFIKSSWEYLNSFFDQVSKRLK